MEDNKILAKMEKYLKWIKINRRLAGPIFIISVIYILVYLTIAFCLWSIGFQMANIQQTLYFISFSVFVVMLPCFYWNVVEKHKIKEVVLWLNIIL